MAKKLKTVSDYCKFCANTGILNADLFRNKETGARKINVILCGENHIKNFAEKSLEDLKNGSGLQVDVIKTEKPFVVSED
jgi:hypothetical protein